MTFVLQLYWTILYKSDQALHVSSLQVSALLRNHNDQTIYHINEHVDVKYSLFSLYLIQQKPTTPATSLFDVSAPFVKWLLYRSLGVLGGLLLMGMVWDICTKRRKAKNENNVDSGERFITCTSFFHIDCLLILQRIIRECERLNEPKTTSKHSPVAESVLIVFFVSQDFHPRYIHKL